MARIVALSSFVARGHIGLGALVPVLDVLGHEVAALPTVMLSNHAGLPHVAGTRTSAAALQSMADALEANGWMNDVGAVVTGYLPEAEHVAFAASLIARVRAHAPGAIIVCDPILGDAPKGLYIPMETATLLKDTLVPLADVLTPNAFELSWLTDRPVRDPREAVLAARCLKPSVIFVTSVPVTPDRVATVLVEPGEASAATTPVRTGVPHGTGDLLAGLLTGALALGAAPKVALAQSAASVDAVIRASLDRTDLASAGTLFRLAEICPLQLETLD